MAGLTAPLRGTRRIILQKARRQAVGRTPPGPPTAWKRTVSGSLSLPSPGCFSPFPHGTVRYRSLCVASLGRWSSLLHTGCHVSGATQAPGLAQPTVPLRGSHALWRRVPDGFGWVAGASGGRQPAVPGLATPRRHGLPADPPARFGPTPGSLAATTGLLLLPRGTEMFQFPRCPPHPAGAVTPMGGWVAPFGDRGIPACVRLPRA